METKTGVEYVAEQMGAKGVKRGIDYEGMEVYEPIFEDGAKVGYPIVIFVKDNKFRLSSPQESLDYLKYKNNHK